jgi:hypothetical protein
LRELRTSFHEPLFSALAVALDDLDHDGIACNPAGSRALFLDPPARGDDPGTSDESGPSVLRSACP